MGFFSGIRRRVRKLIPKEVKPFVPFLAAAIPGMAGLGPIASPFTKAALARIATDEEADIKDALRAGAIAAAPAAIEQGLAGVASRTSNKALAEMATKGAQYLRNTDGKGLTGIKKVGGQAALDFGIKQAELNEKALEQYNADLLQKGIRDKAARRTAIFDIFVGAGYDADETNAMLDKYGYADGGSVKKKKGEMMKMSMKGGLEGLDKLLEELKKKRVKKSNGGKIDPRATDFIILVEKRLVDGGMDPEQAREKALDLARKEFEDTSEQDEYERNIGSNLQQAVSGLETAFGQPLGGRRPEPMRIIPGFAMGGDVDEEVMETEEEIITPDYLMKEEGVEIGPMVSGPDVTDSLNELSLELFGRPIFDLTPEEFDMLRDEAERLSGKYALKPGLIDEYRNYKYQMEEQGITPMSPRDYFRNEFGAARLGVAKGGPIDVKKPDMEKDTKGKTAGPDYYIKRVEDLMDLGYDYDEAGRIAMDYDEYRSAMDKGPIDDYKEGGVIKKKKIKIIGIGKAKDYPGIKKIIEMNKKGKKRFSKAEGGLMNLGGKELDLRGGGFVPMGKKEKADDVPARLSKNEFVFTADAVRAAGGGSVQKGADLMYDTMKKLEAQS